MNTAAQPADPQVLVLPPEQALLAARPLPPRERLRVEGVSEEEWVAFVEALADA